MTKPVLEIDVDPKKDFARYLGKVKKSWKDLTFSMGEIARILKKEATPNFILKGFGKYAPLDPKYARRKNRIAAGTPILVGVTKTGASGKLRDSLIGTTPDSVLRIGKQSLEVGTKALSAKGAPYPVFVQGGTEKMKPRPFWFLTDKMTNRIINTIDDELIRDWENPK